jgi:hypothetical protein
MAKVFMNGEMEGDMRVITHTIKKEDLENIGGLMEKFTKDIGKMEYKMEKENIFCKIKPYVGENGSMEEE